MADGTYGTLAHSAEPVDQPARQLSTFMAAVIRPFEIRRALANSVLARGGWARAARSEEKALQVQQQIGLLLAGRLE